MLFQSRADIMMTSFMDLTFLKGSTSLSWESILGSQDLFLGEHL